MKNGIYNMGVSSLTLTEAAAFTDHILRFTKAHSIVLGLDFWMCNKTTLTQVDWDKNIGTLTYVVRAYLNTLLRPNEVFSILKSSIIKPASQNIQPGEMGEWAYEGFFRTRKRSKVEVDNMLLSYKNYFENVQIDLNLLSLLEYIISQCKHKGAKLYVYISPIHPATKDVYMQSKNAPLFTPWREKIQQLCDTHKIPFYDFTDLLKDSTSLAEGSTDYWLDYSHFSPKVGLTILKSFEILEDDK